MRNDPFNYFDPTGTQADQFGQQDQKERNPEKPKDPELLIGIADYAKSLQRYSLAEREKELSRLQLHVEYQRSKIQDEYIQIKSGKKPDEASKEDPRIRQYQVMEQRMNALAKRKKS